MSNPNILTNNRAATKVQSSQPFKLSTVSKGIDTTHCLPALITKAASKQTYYIIRFLVDRDRVLDAYRAYAYFRWVDDELDEKLLTKTERLAFLKRQQVLINSCYKNEQLSDLNDEEKFLRDLIQRDQEPCSGLRFYILNMMDVMAFDADRRGRWISQHELNEYTRHLSTAVTEALHYFIGHDDSCPHIPTRYLAVMGAHITHMLRDAFEDVALGYLNIPSEFLDAHRLDPSDVNSDAYRTWVKHRVQIARICFKAGKADLAQVKNVRLRIAGYAYIARFEQVLNTIEKEAYRLRPEYSKCKSLRAGLKMSWSIVSMMFKDLIRGIS